MQVVLNLWDSFLSWSLGKKFLLFALICFIITTFQSERLQCIYNKKNKVMKRFFEESKISSLRFTPYLFGFHDLLQTLIYTIFDVVHLNTRPPKMERELVVSKDGTTIGLDWLCDPGKETAIPLGKCEKPIMIFVPGLGGSPNHYYQRPLQN